MLQTRTHTLNVTLIVVLVQQTEKPKRDRQGNKETDRKKRSNKPTRNIHKTFSIPVDCPFLWCYPVNLDWQHTWHLCGLIWEGGRWPLFGIRGGHWHCISPILILMCTSVQLGLCTSGNSSILHYDVHNPQMPDIWIKRLSLIADMRVVSAKRLGVLITANVILH